MQWTDVRLCVCDIFDCNNSLKTRQCYNKGRHNISTIWVTTFIFILQAAGLYRHPSMWLSILSPSLRSNPQHQHNALSLTILGPTSSADLTVGPPLLATMCNTKACFKVASASHLIFMVRLWIQNKLPSPGQCLMHSLLLTSSSPVQSDSPHETGIFAHL